MIVGALIVLGMGLSAFPDYIHQEIPFAIERLDSATISTHSPAPGDDHQSRRMADSSTFVLRMLRADLSAWQSEEARATVREMLRSEDLYDFEREQLEAIDEILRYFAGEVPLDTLVASHWEYLHSSRSRIPMELISRALDTELIAHIEGGQAETVAAVAEKATNVMEALLVLMCQRALTSNTREEHNVPILRGPVSSPVHAASVFPDEFDSIMRRTLDCLPLRPQYNTSLTGVVGHYIRRQLRAGQLDRDEATAFALRFPFEVINDHEVLDIVVGADEVEGVGFLNGEWAGMLVEMCVATGNEKLVPHALAAVDAYVIHRQVLDAHRFPEEMLRYRMDYFRHAFRAASDFLGDFPSSSVADRELQIIHPRRRIATALCEIPLQIASSFAREQLTRADEGRDAAHRDLLKELASLDRALRTRLENSDHNVALPNVWTNDPRLASD